MSHSATHTNNYPPPPPLILVESSSACEEESSIMTSLITHETSDVDDRTGIDNTNYNHGKERRIFHMDKQWNILNVMYQSNPMPFIGDETCNARRIRRRRDKRDRCYPNNYSTEDNNNNNTYDDNQACKCKENSWIDAAPIPAEHPLKITWDVLTIILSLTVGIYTTHAAIRDRCFIHNYNLHFSDSNDIEEHCSSANHRFDLDNVMHARWIPTVEVFGNKFNVFAVFIEFWFFMDIVLNFFTQHKVGDTRVILTEGREIKMRYLKTWFVVDALSLVPWERVLIQPVIDMQNRRNWFQKTFFRSRAIVRVTPKIMRNLRKTNLMMFGRVARRTGWGPAGLVKKMVRYMPRYLLFYRNMKGALAVRTLRQIHWFRKIFKLWWTKPNTESQMSDDSCHGHVNDQKILLYRHTSSIGGEDVNESVEVVLIELSDENYIQNEIITDRSIKIDQHSPSDVANEYNIPLSSLRPPSIGRQNTLGSRILTKSDDGQFVPASPVILRAKRLTDFS